MKTIFMLIFMIGMLISCRQMDEITGNRPIVDTKGVDPDVYQVDLQECYFFADDVQAGRKVVGKAATGAVVGGVIGAAAGNSETANALRVWAQLVVRLVVQVPPCRKDIAWSETVSRAAATWF